jgi:hypothetical protein
MTFGDVWIRTQSAAVGSGRATNFKTKITRCFVKRFFAQFFACVTNFFIFEACLDSNPECGRCMHALYLSNLCVLSFIFLKSNGHCI